MVEKEKKLLVAASALSFGDVAWDGHRGAPQLIRQPYISSLEKLRVEE
jgi:hypothetical protein